MTQAADGLRSMAEQAGVALEVVPRNLVVWGDPDRLLQVLTNLLSTRSSSRMLAARSGSRPSRLPTKVIFRVRDEAGAFRGEAGVDLRSVWSGEDSDSRQKGRRGPGPGDLPKYCQQHGGPDLGGKHAGDRYDDEAWRWRCRDQMLGQFLSAGSRACRMGGGRIDRCPHSSKLDPPLFNAR